MFSSRLVYLMASDICNAAPYCICPSDLVFSVLILRVGSIARSENSFVEIQTKYSAVTATSDG